MDHKNLSRPFHNVLKSSSFWILFMIFTGMLVFNILTPYLADDWNYMGSTSILDALVKEYYQYIGWTGRSVAHFLGRNFLSLPKIIFDVLNAFMFTWMIQLITWIAEGSKEYCFWTILLAFCLVFLSVPTFGQAALWMTGSFNYLWTMVFMLMLILPYRLLEAGNLKKNPNCIGLFLFGMIAGWTNENTAGGMMLILLGFMLSEYLNKKKIQKWQITGFIGAACGFCIMIVSPGNRIRSSQFEDPGLAVRIPEGLQKTWNILISYPGLRYIMMAFICFLMIAVVKKCNKREKWISILFMFSAIACILARILSTVGVGWQRMHFGTTIYAVISVLILLQLDLTLLNKKKIYHLSIIAVFCISMFYLLKTGACLLIMRKESGANDAYIAEQLRKGNDSPVIGAYSRRFETTMSPIYNNFDVVYKPHEAYNDAYARWHGCSSVQACSQQMFHMVYENGDSSIMKIQNLDEYLHELEKREDLITLVMAYNINDSYLDEINLFKTFSIDLSDQSGYAMSQGKLLNASAGGSLEENADSLHYEIRISSDQFNSGIFVNNRFYCMQQNGITMLTVDKNTGKPADIVTITKTISEDSLSRTDLLYDYDY